MKALYADVDATKGGVDAAMQRGWERNTLLSLYFGPSPGSLIDPHESFEGLKDKWWVVKAGFGNGWEEEGHHTRTATVNDTNTNPNSLSLSLGSSRL